MAGGSETLILEQGNGNGGNFLADTGGEESDKFTTNPGDVTALGGEESDKFWSPERLAAFTAIAQNCGELAMGGESSGN